MALLRDSFQNDSLGSHKNTREPLKLPKSKSETCSGFLFDSDSDAQIEAEAESLFQALVHEGMDLPGDHGVPHADIPIGSSEPEREKLRAGRAFYHRNFFVCLLVIITTQLFEVPIQRITGIVMRYANFAKKTEPISGYLRIVMLQLRLLKWFGDGIENKTLESAQDIYKVRRIHEDVRKRLDSDSLPVPPSRNPKKDRTRVLEAIQADLAAHVRTPGWFHLAMPSIMTSTPAVPFSQFEMVIDLGIFYFLFDLNSFKLDLNRDRDYEAYVYYVGIIGRYLGIEDRFNIALHPNPAVRRAVSRKMVHNFIAPCWKHFPELEFRNLTYFTEGTFMTSLSFEVIMHMLVKDVLSIHTAEPARTRTWAECSCVQKLMYKALKLVLFLVRFGPIRCLANFGARAWLWAASSGLGR